jgi:hypothetical protein
MSGGGSQAVTASTIDPRVFNLVNTNYNRAQGVANQPFEQYKQPLVASPSAATLAGQNTILGGATAAGDSTLSSAIAATQGLAGYQPSSITAPVANAAGYSPSLMNPAAVAPAAQAAPAGINRSDVQNLTTQSGLTGIDAYMNPYTQNVVDTTLADLERSRQIATNSDAQRAASAGAFGGSRAGVASSLTNEAYDRNTAATIASLRQSGFNTAADLLQTEKNRALQAGSANQAADLSVAGQNAGFQQQAGLTNAGATNNVNALAAQLTQAAGAANQGAANTASGVNAANQQQANLTNAAANLSAQGANQQAGLTGANLNLNATNALSAMSNEELQNFLTGANSIVGVGGQQDAQQQAVLSAAYQEFLRRLGYPAQQQTLLNQTLGLVNAANNTQSTTQTPASNTLGGLGAVLGGIGLMGSGGIFSSSSSRDAKTDIRTVRVDGKGRRWVSYRYLWDAPTVKRIGVIAEEVARTDPRAVIDGLVFKMVDYSMLEAA